MKIEQVKKQKRLFTIMYLLFLVIIVGVFVLFVAFQDNQKTNGFIFFIVLIPLFVLSLYFKPKIEYLNHQYYLLKLIEEDITPIKYKQNVFHKLWAQSILTKGQYKRHQNNDNYLLLYKVIKDPYKPKKKSYQTLEAILIHKHKNISFNIEAVKEDLFELEATYLKDFKNRSIILVQFMEVDEFNEQTINNIKELTYYKNKRTFHLTLNVGINTTTKEALYVDGENKLYINYYSYGLKLIDTYIN